MLTDLLAESAGPCALVRARHGRMLCYRNDVYIGRSLIAYGEWCEQELALLGPACRPGDVVVDVGASVGPHALAFAHRVGPGGTVHAFEPQAQLAHLLGANAALNACFGIHVHKIALGDREGTIRVPRLDPGAAQNLGGLSLDPPASDHVGGTYDPVPLRPLDACLDPPELRLIKIDVEGMQAAVIRGAAGLIERFRPLVYVENSRRERSDVLIDTLESLGYRLFWHVVPLFSPDNFAGETHNHFPGLVSCNMVGVHAADAVQGPSLAPVHRGSHPISAAPERRLEEATRLHVERRFDAAIDAYRALLDEHPEHPRARYQLGLCLVDAERWQAAADQLSSVLIDQPDNVEARNSLGLAQTRLGALEEGLRSFEQAIASDEQFALAHFNRGLVLLKLGRYAEAWPEYDWRWRTPAFEPFQCAQPLWRGEAIQTKRLLVHSEQGIGDQVQFLRFLALASERCSELIYVGPEKLAALAEQSSGVAEHRLPGVLPADRFDVYCPLMSLPGRLGITLDNLPAPQRYLRIPADVAVRRLGGSFKVGLAWRGSPSYSEDRHRSMALRTLLPILDVRGVTFFSLQLPVEADEKALLAERGVIDLEAELPGFAQTAALIDQLDVVISVDTVTGHIAAALGKTTWTLLAANADWRWLTETERSAWYPTVWLVRQRKQGQWDPVIKRVRQALVDLVR